MQHSLYVVEHRATGRCYIGWTSKAPSARWANHLGYARTSRKTYFHKALHKYGREAFEWRVAQHFETDEQARQAEMYWIARLRDFGVPLYNQTDGGDGTLGYRHSEETRAKMRRPMSAECKAKLSAANKGKPSPMKGRHLSEETKAKLSRVRTGQPSPRKGLKLSEEQKEALKEKLCRPKSAEHRAKLSAANTGKGRPHSDETKEKIRRALTGKPKSAEHRARLSESLVGKTGKSRPHSEETKEKLRQAALRRRREG